MSNINERVGSAAKWSIFTEIIVKIISPITNMILARILVPEEFGVVATVTMIVSFADIFTDAGFQKYVVQHQFKTKEDEDVSTCVAFWTNISASLLLWFFIFIFSNQLAEMVGNPGLGSVIYIGAAILPLTSFSSIQTALFRKHLDFRGISYARIAVKIVPLVVTIPLALMGFSYWALIVGNIVGELCNAVLLTCLSSWKPRFVYSFDKLKEMIVFCGWTLLETISAWMVSNIGIFIIGKTFNDYYLGVYKTSTTMVSQITSIISAATISVLFSALSRLQDDREQYKQIYYKFLRYIGLFVVPLGAGIFVYRDVVTNILLGSQWKEAYLLIGFWGFILSESVIFHDMSGTITLSKGEPKLLFANNMVQAILMVPALYFSAKYGFTALVITSCIVRIQLPIVQTFFAQMVSGIKVLDIFSEIKSYIIATAVMVIMALVMRSFIHGGILLYLSIFVCILIYFGMLWIQKDSRDMITNILNIAKAKILRK